jgi:hypothetical protein
MGLQVLLFSITSRVRFMMRKMRVYGDVACLSGTWNEYNACIGKPYGRDNTGDEGHEKDTCSITQ